MRKDPSYPNAIEADDSDEPVAQMIETHAAAPHDETEASLATAADASSADDTLPPASIPAEALLLDRLLARFTEKPAKVGRPRRGAADATLPSASQLLTAKQQRDYANRVKQSLAASELRLADLETRRGDVDVLDEAQLSAYHAELATARADLETKAAALVNAEQKATSAEATEDERAFEKRARRNQSENVEKLSEHLEALHSAMAAVHSIGFKIGEIKEAIEASNQEAHYRGRVDLTLTAEEVHHAVGLELRDDAQKAWQSPERQGETDAEWSSRLLETLGKLARGSRQRRRTLGDDAEHRALLRAQSRAREMIAYPTGGEPDHTHIERQWRQIAVFLQCERGELETDAEYDTRLRNTLARELQLTRRGETDAAYSLRLTNASASLHASDSRANPLQDAGTKALRAIEAHAFPAHGAEYVRQMNRLRREAKYNAAASSIRKPDSVARFS